MRPGAKMARQNDPFWDYAEKLDDGLFKCAFCGYKFAAGTSVSRIKSHLSGVKGRGVKICEKVPQDVRDAAHEAIDCPPEKKLKTIAGSRNIEVNNAVSTSVPQQSSEVRHVEMAEQKTETIVDAPEARGDARPVTEKLSQVDIERTDWQAIVTIAQLMEEEDVDNGTEGLVQPVAVISTDAPETRPRTEQMQPDCEGRTSDFLTPCTEDNVLENPSVGFTQHLRRSSPERLSINRVEPQEDSSQPADLLCLGPGRHYDLLCSSSLNNDVIMNDVENMIKGTGQHVVRGSSHERLPVNQDEPRGDSSQPTDPLCLTCGRYYDQLCTPPIDNDFIMNDMENMVRVLGQPVMRDSSHEGLQHNGHESRGDAFPTKKLVGVEFEKTKNAIWSWLMNDEASSSMGVYGMGGVGKTALLTHIHNLLLNTRAFFHHVSWITAPQDFTISKLQNLIATEFCVNLSNEDNEKKRAAKLLKELSTKQQWVLILDDLWNYFDFDEVGIPIQMKGCKLILTTRLLGVCQRMLCQKIIKVEPLSSEEAWTLFVENLGHDTSLPPEVEEIAKYVARECAGLPLGIITMSRTMRGVIDIHDWRNALGELEESKVRQDDMEPEICEDA